MLLLTPYTNYNDKHFEAVAHMQTYADFRTRFIIKEGCLK